MSIKILKDETKDLKKEINIISSNGMPLST